MPRLVSTSSIGAPPVPAGSPSSFERFNEESGPITNAVQWCRAEKCRRRADSMNVRAVILRLDPLQLAEEP